MLDPTASVPESFGQQVVVTCDGNALKNMFPSVPDGGRGGMQPQRSIMSLGAQSGDYSPLCRCQAFPLALPNLDRGDLNQLLRAGFADQHSDFVVRGLASV